MTEQQRQGSKKDREQDEAVKDSFPASDPPANTGITGPGGSAGPGDSASPGDSAAGQKRRSPAARDDEERPTGTPTSDRHATETAFVWEHEERPPAQR